MMRGIILFVLLLSTCFGLWAQDLNAHVQILSPQIQSSNKRVLDGLETVVRDFLNDRKWSNDKFQPQERIECNLIINITSWDGGSNFKGEAQILSSRPVYGTAYSSTLLNFSDKDFNFTYAEGQPLDYSDQNFIGNLSSLLAFYAYTIVGIDYDSFSKLGGTPYYTKAQTVINNAQNTAFAGWKAFEGLRNRYWLAENLTNKAYNPIRETLYEYHRNGLDIMYDNQPKGIKQILSILPELEKIDRQKQGAMLNQVFFTAKADEIINILNQASPQDKIKAYNILSQIDPSNIGKYDALKR
jgi:hypothetical protein